MKEKIQKILTKVNKPSRYIGKELGSINKDWNTAAVKVALAFPDLYEIGISNLGLRILYDKINRYKNTNFLADRVYAPEVDFRDEIKKNNIPLYGLESLKPLNEFDMLAFSLQYELSYPTILAMFEMADIPIKSADRTEFHPIIAAGGPGCYNPEPISDFIDMFLIGDGETVIIELLETIQKAKSKKLSREATLKLLAKISGVYVPKFYNSEGYSKPVPVSDEFASVISKRIDDIDNQDYPVEFPIPYCSAVHDRAVVEIRRGCGRMCRFCQACFVNFPVRERSPEHVVNIVDTVLKNTGYDEYSLLALSSNDYQNIEKLVEILNEKHSSCGVSISLPSQRADKFSLKLAGLVQSVRKSTITIAPEAGSQRLRDVINKNLTEQQILDAVESVYKTGWHNIKLYFMIGLPTETFDDLDAIAKLLHNIKERSRQLKNEFALKKFLSITCTISIFVPKPFTPFQWCAQDNLQIIREKIQYLRDKTRHIKDVKLNYHDSFLCMLESVFSKGNRDLNSLVEEAYKNGSYLDAWNEHFNKNIWLETAESLSINLEELASTEFNLNQELPWDIFNIGVDKNWLIKEYENALNSKNSSPCDEICSDCGVCKNFDTTPSLKGYKLNDKVDFPDKQTEIADTKNTKIYAENQDNVSRFRMKIRKINELKYISNLDWQKLIYSSVKRAGIKINYSQGFNPSPKISVAVALPIFIEGQSEYAEMEVQGKISAEEFKEKLNTFLPENSKILEIVNIYKEKISLDKSVCWAKYSALAIDKEKIEKINLKSIVKNCLLQENVIIEKSSKKGVKKINIRPAIHSLVLEELDGQYKLDFILKTGQGISTNKICTVSENMQYNETVSVQNQNINNDCADTQNSKSDGSLQDLDEKTKTIENMQNACVAGEFISALRADHLLEFLTPEVEWNIIREKLLNCNFEELF